MDHNQRDGEMLIVKESKLVNIQLVQDGMLRFAFLQEVCQPGTVPDSPLLAAALDLVSGQAAFLLCKHPSACKLVVFLLAVPLLWHDERG